MSVTITPKKMVAGSALTGSAATYYTVAATVQQAVVKEVEFCNTDSVPRTVTMYIIPSGGSAGVANEVYAAVTIQAGETKTFSRSTVMLAGGFIQALASSAAVVSFNVSGVEYT
jgi:hypothetical protein